ncbi:MarR family winged helix-turn-helix transcriptional regulator [Streptomyces stelliscabiei]|uniref:MarR family winged helix-turn-helix transcriptional regulator n=1 Tax=Streptomyces stelliscabiei TaxID=146820 RepID=UPI0029A261E6|nr:MarR family winged helix-turn-helix transcriptional regulator [Streptomyces stelliscabiei]MDX2661047.1 MarR family winged helix-turn-helix transcriptional regulator [Streptomyces stelliscabiei]MDX2715914.1 MarR family winged helix-turn-helix transcriptional regulator [Streptomyces stelliscabiei]MDX2790024.1 MarR family winged helix-turn-helix transcriptional regulator [Streptomyces stelliscabiei]
MVLRADRQGAAEHGHRITAAIACHVARAGGTVDQLTQLLLHPEHEGGRHTRNIALRSGQSRALDYIRRVWASASDAISATIALSSRHEAYEVLAALRDRIETTPWRGERGRTALRVLRAHLNFAEIAGGPLHHASERQTAEEAGVSRTTLRVVYETVLRPRGWLRRLRVGHGREGSTWYLGEGTMPGHGDHALLSRFRSTQFPPDPPLEEWTTPETATTADIDSTVLARLMAHDAFAPHALGSAALVIISALHQHPHQTVAELVGTSSVPRATTYRTLKRLAAHGLVQHTGEAWTLAPRALEGFGIRLPDADNGHTAAPAQGWAKVAEQHGTWGTAARRKALHTAERAAYQQALDRLSEHRSRAVVLVRDGRQVLVPMPRPDEIPPAWHAPDGLVLDPVTGRPAADWRVATDGRLILITPADQRSYDELAAAHAEALSEWESVA